MSKRIESSRLDVAARARLRTAGAHPGMSVPELVLASSSPYRQQLLARFGLTFECVAPAIDERPRDGEAPGELVARLAETKARRVAGMRRGALVIGADQVAVMDGHPLGKPGDRVTNIVQLEAAAGKWVEFLTGVCLLNAASGRSQVAVSSYAVEMRRLSMAQIERYVDREQPFDCAGGFKAEGLGISLFQRMRGDDPTALIGLPLITLRRMLEDEGIDVLCTTADR